MKTHSTASQLYAELERHLGDDDLDGSLLVLDQICRLHDDHAGAWEMRGLLEAKAGRPNLSVRYFERASELASLEIWSSRTLAIQYVAIDRKELAAEVLHVLGLSGRLETAMLRVVSHDLLTLERPELAADITWNAIKSDRENALLWHELSAIQSVLGESPETCLQSVQRAIELAPVTTEFRVTAATLMIRMDQVQAAYDVVRQVVTPRHVELDCPCCLWRLICIFESFDDHERMAVCYDRLTGIEAQKTFQTMAS
ncbi:MAG: hypothetical protein AAGJ40_22760 [Planctomycetota bacterium]